MNDKLNLKEWLTFHKDHDQMRKLFYQMDAKMKYIQGKGYYIMNFQPNKIEIGNNDVFFEELGTMTQQDYQALMDHNIYTLSFLAIASYSDCLDFLKPSFLNEHFEEFVPFLPTEDVLYYRSVMQGKKYYYLNDYANIQQQQSGLDEVKSGDASNQHQRSLVKATAAGKIYQGEEEHLSNAAFVNVVVLSSFVVASTLITLLTVMLVALK